MAASSSTEGKPVREVPVSSEELIAVTSGISGDSAERRVWAASVSDRALRRRLGWSLPPEDEEEQIADAVAEAPLVISERLRQRMMLLSAKYGTPQKKILQERFLEGVRTLLNLPCFSPAYAASEADASFLIASQAVESGEGVRLVFQQLPHSSAGDSQSTLLRVIVDASALSVAAGYTAATVTIADDDGVLFPLTVPLNREGKGLLDVSDLPPATSPRHLDAVLLSAE